MANCKLRLIPVAATSHDGQLKPSLAVGRPAFNRGGGGRQAGSRSCTCHSCARVAVASGLDLERFHKDLAGPDILGSLARDHLQAVNEHGVFGTPTFALPDGASAYGRLSEAPDAAQASRVFDRVISIAAGEPSILEIKRPRKPARD